jgi:hypothetical protein
VNIGSAPFRSQTSPLTLDNLFFSGHGQSSASAPSPRSAAKGQPHREVGAQSPRASQRGSRVAEQSCPFGELRLEPPGPPAEDHLQREALPREHLLGELVTKRLGKHDYFTTVIVRISVLALKTKGNERSYASP